MDCHRHRHGPQTVNLHASHAILDKEILPTGKVQRYTYNQKNQPLTVETLDPSERYIYTSTPIPPTPAYSEQELPTQNHIWDSRNWLTTHNQTHYTYDNFGNPTQEIENGKITKRQFSQDGRNLLLQEDGVKYTYLPNTNLITQINTNDTLFETFIYDTNNNLIQKTDQGGITTQYHLKQQPPNLHKPEILEIKSLRAVHFHYDENGNVTSHDIYDANNNYAYTKNGPYTEERTYPYPQKIPGHTYKGVNLISKTDPAGYITTYTYDQFNRLTREEFEGHVTTYSYDPLGNLSLIIKENDHFIHYNRDTYGNLLSIQTKDTLGNLLTETTPLPHPTKNYPPTVIPTYDQNGLLLSLKSTDNTIHYTYTYNPQGYLIQATDQNQHITIKRKLDPHGNILREDFPTNLSLLKTYDAHNRPLTLTLPDYGTIRHTYHPKTTTYPKDLPAPPPQETYETNIYDPLNRLIETTADETKIQYTYDPLDRPLIKITYTYSFGIWQATAREHYLYDNTTLLATYTPSGICKNVIAP